jgi:hypothetical protein
MTFDAHSTPDDHAEVLSDADAKALDAILGESLPIDQTRKHHAQSILNLLGTPSAGTAAEDRRTLVDLAFARAIRTPRPEPILTVMDTDAADAFDTAQHRADRVPAVLAERAGRLHDLSELLSSPVARFSEQGSSSKTLVDNVMFRIAEADADRRDRMKIVPGRSLGVMAMASRWRDVVSVAAVLLIATSVFWTLAGAASQVRQRAACLSGLRGVASAMSGYANDFKDALPMATASLGGGRWWDVRRDQPVANSANLYTLARTSYAKLSELACPGNKSACRKASCEPGAMDWANLDEVSYSYQIMFGPHRPSWNSTMRHVILADRSPVVRRAVAGEPIRPDENSMSHNGRGQHVLFSDGTAEWLRSPILPDGDNLWLPKPVRIEISVHAVAKNNQVLTIHGRELPRDPSDAFVGP